MEVDTTTQENEEVEDLVTGPKQIKLSFDKSLGFVFGTIKGFSFTVLITFFIMNTELASLKMITDSQFIPYFEDFLNNYLISSDSLFDSLQLKI